MLRFWKTFRYFAIAGLTLQMFGCGWGGGSWGSWWGSIWTTALTYIPLEFLTDNNGIFDLFTDS